MDKTRINFENVIDPSLEYKRKFYLKNKSELPFVSAFQYKVMKYASVTELEFVNIFENLLENNTYAMEIYSNSSEYA
jgi:hypothetical protein